MDMKLSDAIRNGAKRHPASESGWTDIGPDGEIRTCALMAAAEEAGIVLCKDGGVEMGPNGRQIGYSDDMRGGGEPLVWVKAPDAWETVMVAVEMPPCPCAVYGLKEMVAVIIWHLHDIHRWSREAVSEWVGTVENKIEAQIECHQKMSEIVEKKKSCEATELVKKP